MIKAPTLSPITPILRPLHWLKVNELIKYKVLLLTYKVLTDLCTVYMYMYTVSQKRPNFETV